MQPFISEQKYYFKRFSDGNVFLFISDCKEIRGSHIELACVYYCMRMRKTEIIATNRTV